MPKVLGIKAGRFLKNSLDRVDMPIKYLTTVTKTSKQAISDYTTERHAIPVEKLKKFADQLHDIHFNEQISALTFGTEAPRTQTDLSQQDNPFLLAMLQKDEEQDRVVMTEKAYRIYMRPENQWSLEDRHYIRKFLNKFSQEIATEKLTFIALCKLADEDAFEIYERQNKENLKG